MKPEKPTSFGVDPGISESPTIVQEHYVHKGQLKKRNVVVINGVRYHALSKYGQSRHHRRAEQAMFNKVMRRLKKKAKKS